MNLNGFSKYCVISALSFIYEITYFKIKGNYHTTLGNFGSSSDYVSLVLRKMIMLGVIGNSLCSLCPVFAFVICRTAKEGARIRRSSMLHFAEAASALYQRWLLCDFLHAWHGPASLEVVGGPGAVHGHCGSLIFPPSREGETGDT